MDALLSMSLHEVIRVDMSLDYDFANSIMRVPGGWIYRSYDKGNNMMSSVFVPEPPHA